MVALVPSKIWSVLLLLLICTQATAQSVTISGVVTDAQNGETMIGATVYDAATNQGTISNEYGHFRLIAKAPVNLVISYVGYQPYATTLPIHKDTIINVALDQNNLLNAIIVSAENEFQENGDHLKISPKSIAHLPKLGAEVDIIKSIQLISGVESGLESSTNFNVRGGSSDQNRIYVDNITLYNTGHLGNIISVFDPYTINSIDFYKNGFPSKFGGALSSVSDIYLREGDKKHYHGELSLGFTSAKIAAEGPIQKDKSSFLISYRRSFFDLILNAMGSGVDPTLANYHFYDLTLKLNNKINEKNHIYASLYIGNDKIQQDINNSFKTSDDATKTYQYHTASEWGNMAGAFRWNHLWNSSTFSNLTLDFTSYHSNHLEKEAIFINDETNKRLNSDRTSSIRDFELKYDFQSTINDRFSANYGLQHTFRIITPINQKNQFYRTEPAIEYETNHKISDQGFETALYGDLSIAATNTLNITTGLRLVDYHLFGNKNVFFAEPRIHAMYDYTQNTNFSVEYARMNQTVSSFNNTTASLNANLFVPANDQIPASQSDQYSITASHRIDELQLKTSVFYKQLRRLIESPSPSANFILENQWQEKIYSGGTGYSQGLELEASRHFQKLFLQANYTLSKSRRKFDEINDGHYYPFDFDRKHNLTFIGDFSITQKLSLSVLWTYKSGQAITLSNQVYDAYNNYVFNDGRYFTDELNNTYFTPTLNLSQRNNYRMPEYHRLDISINYEKAKKKGRIATWNLSIYNAYNRKNPYTIYIKQVEDQLQFYQLTMFPIIPSISYSLKF